LKNPRKNSDIFSTDLNFVSAVEIKSSKSVAFIKLMMVFISKLSIRTNVFSSFEHSLTEVLSFMVLPTDVKKASLTTKNFI